MIFNIFERVAYGPIGRNSDWIVRFRHLGTIEADDACAAVLLAKAAGYVAPMVAPA